MGADQDYYFFEINPSGQFLFLEADAGLPVCDAVASLLIKRAYCAGYR